MRGDYFRDRIVRGGGVMGYANVTNAASTLPLGKGLQLSVYINQIMHLHQIDWIGAQLSHRLFHLPNSGRGSLNPDFGGNE